MEEFIQESTAIELISAARRQCEHNCGLVSHGDRRSGSASQISLTVMDKRIAHHQAHDLFVPSLGVIKNLVIYMNVYANNIVGK